MAELYKNIKKLRQQKGWSQEHLAELMGYSGRSMISKIERGEIDLTQSRIKQFADIFNISPDDLMGTNKSITNVDKELSPTAVKVGKQLSDLEKKFGYTDQQVADAMKISLDHYHDVKNGVNHILDPNLMCKLAAFYDKKWTDFFTFDGIPVPVNDNIVALQQMAGLKDDEVCKAVGLSLEDYNLIRMGEKQADYSTLEKFCHLYNIPFSMLLGSNLMQHADEPKKKLSVKFQVYINQISNALHGEEFDKQDMEELINYIEYMAIKKKRVRESEEK
nr:MAG TPA: helix-turn-helix domain protein [Caudoviricetes sp.]